MSSDAPIPNLRTEGGIRYATEDYPYITWATEEFLREKVRNFEDAQQLAFGSEFIPNVGYVRYIERCPSADDETFAKFKVKSLSGGSGPYTVSLSHACVDMEDGPEPVRAHIKCTCMGYTVSLAKQKLDFLCLHCGGVLLAIRDTHLGSEAKEPKYFEAFATTKKC